MPSLLQLIKGTQQVIKTSVDNATDPMSISNLKITNMTGVQTKHITGNVKSQKTGKMYNCWMLFTGIKNPTEEKPKTGETNCFVRCNCESFYFYAATANKKHKALAGRGFRPYFRKTPVTDPKYPPKNPNQIPLLCKHLIFLTRYLTDKNYME